MDEELLWVFYDRILVHLTGKAGGLGSDDEEATNK